MTNLEAKQEAIKKAYGEYWELVKDLVRTDGSLSEPVWRGSDINIDYDDYSTGYFRPKSLQGIENNNGWIRIESEDDLPKDESIIEFWVLDDDEIIHAKFMHESKRWYDGDELNIRLYPTHYQPIEKPKPPIY